jgi:hypothetical protein
MEDQRQGDCLAFAPSAYGDLLGAYRRHYAMRCGGAATVKGVINEDRRRS